MLYRDTTQFQRVLRAALQLRAQEEAYSDAKMIGEAGLDCGKSTLHRFRRGGATLNSQNAEKLWVHLEKRDGIEKAIRIGLLDKKELYSMAEVASGVHCFYASEQNMNKKYADTGLVGKFFCYKPSFRRTGFVVKSVIEFIPAGDVFFRVQERQLASGIFEVDKKPIVEEAEGFGFIKTDRLWLFLRDIETEQPRIFCFDKKKSASQTNAPVNNRISTMDGYVLEGAMGNANGAFEFRVTLIEQAADLDLWDNDDGNARLDVEEHLDVYPATTQMKERYAKVIEGRKRIFVPDEVVGYLLRGARSSFDVGEDDRTKS